MTGAEKRILLLESLLERVIEEDSGLMIVPEIREALDYPKYLSGQRPLVGDKVSKLDEVGVVFRIDKDGDLVVRQANGRRYWNADSCFLEHRPDPTKCHPMTYHETP